MSCNFFAFFFRQGDERILSPGNVFSGAPSAVQYRTDFTRTLRALSLRDSQHRPPPDFGLRLLSSVFHIYIHIHSRLKCYGVTPINSTSGFAAQLGFIYPLTSVTVAGYAETVAGFCPPPPLIHEYLREGQGVTAVVILVRKKNKMRVKQNRSCITITAQRSFLLHVCSPPGIATTIHTSTRYTLHQRKSRRSWSHTKTAPKK